MASLIHIVHRLGGFGSNRKKRSKRGPFGSTKKRPTTRLQRLETLEERSLLSVVGAGELASQYLPPRINLSNPGDYLTGPASGAPLDIAMDYLSSHADQMGLTANDVRNSVVTDQYSDSRTGMTHIYLQQQLNGIPIVNARINVNVAADGRILNVGGGYVPGLDASKATRQPALTPVETLQRTIGGLGLQSATAPALVATVARSADEMQITTLVNQDLSLDPIPAKLQYVATGDGVVELAWDYVLRTPDGQHWYHVDADGATGKSLFANDWVDHASYNVFALPTETPDDGTRSLAVNPNDPVASPYGWHDTDGLPGAEYTDTRGNNVFAQEDWNDDDSGGTRPSGGTSLTFDFPLDLTQAPDAYVDAAVTNLFYWNNITHDIHYQYGFDEAAGNFQRTNYSGLGLGNDAVQADAQDGKGADIYHLDNANFATPPEGQTPRMQMYDFDLTTPYRDGDLESMIMVHEYGHGVSNRLVGGPFNVDALWAQQSGGMGEGWSDWWGLMFTQKPSDAKMDSYPVGTYVLGESSTGGGIRRYPYSFDMRVDPLTYGVYNVSQEVHDAGEIWCSALWDMTWLLIDKYGYSSNLASGYTGAGSAGNILALQLVMDSLKLAPVYPTFLDGRDAILAADQVLTGGANELEIWTAFARRGMGLSAYDGGYADAMTVFEAFDMPVINQAPVLNVQSPLSLRPVQQGDSMNFGTRITTMLASGGGDPITDQAGSKEGIAIIGANTANGTWQYTINNGVSWKTMGKVSNTSAQLLASDTATRLRFVPNSSFTGIVAPAITFRAWDQSSGINGGLGNAIKNGARTAFSTGIATASITVREGVETPLANRAPVLDATLNLSLPLIASNDDSENVGATVQEVLESGGQMAAADADDDSLGIAVTGADNTHGAWQYSADDGATWDGFAAAPSVSAAVLLDLNTRIRFVPDADFSGVLAEGLSFRAWDHTQGSVEETVDTTVAGGTTAFSASIATASIAVNHAPVLNLTSEDRLQLAAILEDDVASEGTSITDILDSWPADRATGPITDSDPGSQQGVAIVAVDDGGGDWGAWQYRIPGADWKPIDSPSDSEALLLAADGSTRVRFVPAAGFNTPDEESRPTIAFRAWDRSSGLNGGVGDTTDCGGRSAFSTTDGAMAVEVVPVNDPPTLALGADVEVLENSGARLIAHWASASAAPAGQGETGQTVGIFIVSNDNTDLFAVEPEIDPITGDLTFQPAPYAAGTAILTVQARDDGGILNGGWDTSDPATFTITVLPVNDRPSFTAGPDQAVNENVPQQVVSPWATDISCGQGESGQALRFVIDHNSNPGLFAVMIDPDSHAEVPAVAISPDGTLTYTLANSVAGSATITVSLHDDGGTANGGSDTSIPRAFTIVVNPVNAGPVATAQSLSTNVNAAIDFQLLGDDGDPDVSQTLTYALGALPKHGRITSFDPATGKGTYVPAKGFQGLDQFTFTVTDDNIAGNEANLTSDPATVKVSVSPLVRVPAGKGANNLVLRLVKGNRADGSQDRLRLTLSNGNITRTLFNQFVANLQKLTIVGAGSRANQLIVDIAGGKFSLPEGVVFDGGSAGGDDRVTLRGTSGNDTFVVDGNQATVDGLQVFLQRVGQLRLEGKAGADSYSLAAMPTPVTVADTAGNDSYAIAALGFPLRINDSAGADRLDFSQAGAGAHVDLRLNKGQTQQVFAAQATLSLNGAIENVIGSGFDDVIWGNAAANRIWGGAGRDTLYGSGNDFLYGEAGNDSLYGGAGADVLLGGEGDDALRAGTTAASRSVLIGGLGKDSLQGSAGDTVFIGGTTAYDNNDAALMAIVAEWRTPNRSFDSRVNNLKTGIGTNGSIKLQRNTTVFDDGVVDEFDAGLGNNWFLGFGTEPA